MKMIAALIVLIIMFAAVVGLSLNKLGWITPKPTELVPYEILEVEPKPEVKIDLIPEIKNKTPDPIVLKPIVKIIKKEQPQPKLGKPTNIVPPLPYAKPEIKPKVVKDRAEWVRDPGRR